jgi:membrane-associated HD superfamily phosphohydrolase
MISARMVPILAEMGMGVASMSSILILLALSALSGYVLGIGHFSWPAILVAGAVLAPLSAVLLQNQGFGVFSGISIIIACLTINQAAYVFGGSVPKMVRTTGLSRLYLSNEPTTNHAMVATMTFAVNISDSRTVNSSWPNSPIRRTRSASRFTEFRGASDICLVQPVRCAAL